MVEVTGFTEELTTLTRVELAALTCEEVTGLMFVDVSTAVGAGAMLQYCTVVDALLRGGLM